MTLSAVTLFCEDIRREVQGTESLVGILPNNLNIEIPEGNIGLPRLGIYTRINFNPSSPPDTITVCLRSPLDEEQEITTIEPDLIQKSRSGNPPIAGVISRMVASPFLVPESGKLIAVVKYDGEELISGFLNVQLKRT